MTDEQLPIEFADLQELANQFAIGDDVERSQRTDAAAPDELRKLVDSVWPRLPAINEYLDVHDDESAHLLGRLAEAACEVAIQIGSPNSLK